jgi:hypothetical protein
MDIVAPRARRSTPTSTGAAMRRAGNRARPKLASPEPFTVRQVRHGSASSRTIPAPGSSSWQRSLRAAPSSPAGRTILLLAFHDRWTRFGASLMILPILIACSSKPPKQATPPSIVATTTTTTQAQLEAVILSQWRLAQQTLTALQKDPTSQPTYLLMADYITEPLLSFSRTQFTARARDGLADIGTIDFGQAHVESVMVGHAIVASCINDGLALVDRSTGKPLPGTNPNPQIEGTRSTMLLSPSGVWKLSDSVIKAGSCDGI